jgi:hypothetical protein
VYYINIDGRPAERDLAIQVVVYSEMPREDYGYLLKAMAPGIDMATVEKIESMPEADKEVLSLPLEVMYSNNKHQILTFYKEADMKGWNEFWELASERGMLDENNQKYLQMGEEKGIQKGRQEILALLEKGYSLEETKKRLQLA